jgi:hypothetical protein
MQIHLTSGILVELVGQEIIAASPHGQSFRLVGDSADIVARLSSTASSNVAHTAVVQELLDAGIITSDDERAVIPRRHLLGAGAAGALAGITMLTLPTAALASSTKTVQLYYRGFPSNQNPTGFTGFAFFKSELPTLVAGATVSSSDGTTTYSVTGNGSGYTYWFLNDLPTPDGDAILAYLLTSPPPEWTLTNGSTVITGLVAIPFPE